jgi:4-diphosphocytidyl-2-C-methyl-D-erythritol kinase
MLIRRRGECVRVWSPAKVNLFLEVMRKRPDGYHDLTTLMVTVGRYDTLEFCPDRSGLLTLHCDHPGLSTGPDNLVSKAVSLLQQRTGLAHGVRITLRKRIPMQAGLAGGSSNAAATLLGLDRLWRLGLSRQELARLGSELGSDVPFFFSPRSAAWCTGRGEIVEPWLLPGPLDFVLACPPVGLATREVFTALPVPEQPVDSSPLRRALQAGDVGAAGGLLFNRLQEIAERLCPAVAEVRQRLEATRPAGVLMSGSGTTVFALCRGRAEAQRIARALRSVTDDEGGGRVSAVRCCD